MAADWEAGECGSLSVAADDDAHEDATFIAKVRCVAHSLMHNTYLEKESGTSGAARPSLHYTRGTARACLPSARARVIVHTSISTVKVKDYLI